MRLAIIALTRGGVSLGQGVQMGLRSDHEEVTLYTLEKWRTGLAPEGSKALALPMANAVGLLFEQYDGLICIMATGIVVRSIAPHLKSKTTDPAVIVLDEQGTHVISLLSGHLGGANALTEQVADICNGSAVITTASDVTETLAVDTLAQFLNCSITDMKKAKEVTALMVSGEAVDILLDDRSAQAMKRQPDGRLQLRGRKLPPHIRGWTSWEHMRSEVKGRIILQVGDTPVPKDDSNRTILCQLVYRDITAGIGCRKGIDPERLWLALHEACRMAKVSVLRVGSMATVEIKAQEPALLEVAKRLAVPVQIISYDDIRVQASQFEGSDFVEQTIGVRAVAEPCGFLGSGKGKKRLGKTAFNGITISLWEDER